jgi:hypothetical protein
MKWISKSTRASAANVYHLNDGEHILQILRYNPMQQSVRVESKQLQRLFFIERQGLRGNHFKFKNEYGFTTGALDNESGIIGMEEKKYHFRTDDNPVHTLEIFDQYRFSPLLRCQFTESIIGKNEYAALLLGLCWHLFTPVAMENYAVRNLQH